MIIWNSEPVPSFFNWQVNVTLHDAYVHNTMCTINIICVYLYNCTLILSKVSTTFHVFPNSWGFTLRQHLPECFMVSFQWHAIIPSSRTQIHLLRVVPKYRPKALSQPWCLNGPWLVYFLKMEWYHWNEIPIATIFISFCKEIKRVCTCIDHEYIQ